MSTLAKNTLLAGVSALTYSSTQLGTSNQNMLRDSISFGIFNGLAQEFVPKIVKNEDLQSLFVDPLIASVAQGLLLFFVYDNKSVYTVSKSIVAGVSASALTLHMYDGNKKY